MSWLIICSLCGNKRYPEEGGARSMPPGWSQMSGGIYVCDECMDILIDNQNCPDDVALIDY